MTLYYGFDKKQVILAVKYDLSLEESNMRCSSATGEYVRSENSTVFRTQLSNGKLVDIEVDDMTEEELTLFNDSTVQHALIVTKEKLLVLSSDTEEELDEMILEVYAKHYKLTSKKKVEALLKRYENFKKHLSWFAQGAVQ